jgi:hypothetical protein
MATLTIKLEIKKLNCQTRKDSTQSFFFFIMYKIEVGYKITDTRC